MENKKSFELNLLPVISLLAVCISFLLLTSVWVHIGSLDIAQAIGTESDKKVQPSMSVTFQEDVLLFQIKDSSQIPPRVQMVKSLNQEWDWDQIKNLTDNYLDKEPELKMALILPASNSKYQDIVKLIDTFKTKGITDVGIAPL